MTLGIKENYTKLCGLVNHYNHLYFNESNPSISDAEYDKQFAEIIKIETEHPELIIPNSPTQRIGAEPISEFIKVEHNKPMMSIEKVFNHKDLVANMNRIRNTFGSEVPVNFLCEYKIDGLALSLRYDADGYLIKASTRGDGNIGEDVTHNAKVIQSIPLRVSGGFKGPFEIRGEVCMTFKVFEELNKQKAAKNEQLLANPRNAASGAMKRKDSKLSKESKLTFVAYDLIDSVNYGISSQSQILDSLKDLGFNTPIRKFIDTNNYDFILELMENEKDSLPYPIDGLVIKLDDIFQRDKFENTSSHPKWMVAYKFTEELAETDVIDIIVQVGKTGVLTPVAVFEPTELCGSIIRKASLHNYDIIDTLDIRVGDTVSIKKAGEIIPQVVSVISKGDDRGPKVVRPSKCPVCNSDTYYEGENVALICSGYNCDAKLSGKLEYWASKDVMDIDGLGPAIVEQFIDNKLVTKSFVDIYNIKLHEIESLERMGKRSSEKLFNAIKESIKKPFNRVLCGLQIPQIGRTTSKLLSKHYKNIDNLMNTTIDELIDIDGIGDISANLIYNWFKEPNNIFLIEKIKEIGFNLEIDETEAENENMNGKFSGETVCVTGTLQTGTRQVVHSNIVKEGGLIADSINKKTTILIVGDKAGSKLDKAKKLGIRIMPEYEYAQLLGIS